MVGGPGRPGARGRCSPLVCAVSFAVMLVITRHRRERLDGARDLPLAGRSCSSSRRRSRTRARSTRKDLVLLAGLGIGQIGLGLIFLTIGARLIPAAEVALITLLEIVLGPLWVWIARGEQPSAATLAGGAIVLGAVVFQAVAAPQAEPATPPP